MSQCQCESSSTEARVRQLDRRRDERDLYQQHNKISVDAGGLNDMIYDKN
jgi:hypothetical protein